MSNWVIKTLEAGGIAIGAYPAGQAELHNERITLRSGAVAALLLEGTVRGSERERT